MRRFVVLRHELPPPHDPAVHWDFMIEDHESLLTWAVAEEPHPGLAMIARQLPDHRKHYLTYEGPVSGGRGNVTRYDHGEFEWLHRSDDEVLVRVAGGKLNGQVLIVRSPEQPEQWSWQITHGPEGLGSSAD
jgi:hypothetical protein